jgi:hypothetical protein
LLAAFAQSWQKVMPVADGATAATAWSRHVPRKSDPSTVAQSCWEKQPSVDEVTAPLSFGSTEAQLLLHSSVHVCVSRVLSQLLIREHMAAQRPVLVVPVPPSCAPEGGPLLQPPAAAPPSSPAIAATQVLVRTIRIRKRSMEVLLCLVLEEGDASRRM